MLALIGGPAAMAQTGSKTGSPGATNPASVAPISTSTAARLDVPIELPGPDLWPPATQCLASGLRHRRRAADQGSIAIVVIRFRISLLLNREQQSSADDPAIRWVRSCGDPVPHSPAPCGRRHGRAARRPPPQHHEKAEHHRFSMARLPWSSGGSNLAIVNSSSGHGFGDKGERRRIVRQYDSAIPDAVRVLRERICVRQRIRVDR